MSKRYHDWYNMQGWDHIPADKTVADILAPMDLSINFDHCHYGLKHLLAPFVCAPHDQPDFFIITEIELSKRPLNQFFQLVKDCFDRSKKGVYVAALSYYLKPDKFLSDHIGPYSRNIDHVFRENFNFASRIDNYSSIIDYPLVQAEKENFLIEGSNFIFVHPNIKYFLWKD